MTNAIVLHTQADILATSRTLIESGLLPREVKTPQQAFAIITMGLELGLGMWQALNGINVIYQRPSISGQLMLALIRRSGHLENINITANDKEAIVTMRRKGEDAHTERFTFDDAQRLGLTGKDGYKKQPAVMLKWRAVAACARIVFPDVIMGLYTPEELAPDDTTVGDDGSMTYNAVTIERPAEPAPQPAPVDQPQHGTQRTFAIVRVKRAPVPDGKPVWGMWGIDTSAVGSEAREVAISGLETRDALGEQKGAADNWNTKVNAVTVLEETILVKATFEDGRWWFDEAVGG